MRILAIDTSCDDSCVAILETESFELLADVVQSHTETMQPFGGVVPELASREHLKALPIALEKALEISRLLLRNIDWIVVTHRPGLIGALLVGVSFAKSLAYALSKPFTGLSHIEAHLFSPFLALTEGQSPPPLPWIVLVVSGGHTELFEVQKDFAKDFSYVWLGGTLDDAAGEAFDKIGKLIGLKYPAGPLIDAWVREAATPELRSAFAFPRATTPGLSFSFSGLKTAVALVAERPDFASQSRLPLVASAQEAILDGLCAKIQIARERFPHHSLVVTGGVACNSRLREKLTDAHFPKPRHCTDNAAMVAILAAIRHREGQLTASPWNLSAASR